MIAWRPVLNWIMSLTTLTCTVIIIDDSDGVGTIGCSVASSGSLDSLSADAPGYVCYMHH